MLKLQNYSLYMLKCRNIHTCSAIQNFSTWPSYTEQYRHEFITSCIHLFSASFLFG